MYDHELITALENDMHSISKINIFANFLQETLEFVKIISIVVPN